MKADHAEEEDGQAIAQLWQEALQGYKGVGGKDLRKGFTSTRAMIEQATKDMENFHKFRHNEKKVDRLRTILIENFGYIEAGTQQLATAASSAFPPAAAIGAALTYFMGACRLVSADYDTVTVFFEDMKSFLQRIIILETRLPKSRHYRVCVLDVFASFLIMCGLAQKFVELGRFRKWVSNLVNGEDSELASARKDMDLKLERLQNATENAILGNTEEQIKMAQELEKNAKHHSDVLHQQLEIMKSVQDTTERMSEDLAKLIKTIEEQRNKVENGTNIKSLESENKPLTAMRIRNMLPAVHDEELEYRMLKRTMVDDTCTWVFSESNWREWLKKTSDEHSVLAITGLAGFGKSHISAAVYDKLKEKVDKDTKKHICVTQFHFKEHNPALSTFLPAISSIIGQIAEQSSSMCAFFNAQWQNDEIQIQTSSWQNLVRCLLLPAFKRSSQNVLLIVMDGVDEMQNPADFAEFTQILSNEGASISLALTGRPGTFSEVAGAEDFLMINVSLEKQEKDLKTLIWQRLNSLWALRTFSHYVQQRIADRLETVAPSMLYAEHVLNHLNTLGREGAVLRTLDQQLPTDLNDIYDTMRRDCYRRTDASYHITVTKLLYWVVYSYRPLTLDEVTLLAKLWTENESFDLDDIPEPFSKFLRIGDPGADAEARANLQAQETWGTAIVELEEHKDTHQPNAIFDDGGLLVKLRERSLRSFFREIGQNESPYCWTSSQSCFQIFLDCVSIARSSKLEGVKAVKKLKSFAVDHLVRYWEGIKVEELSIEEQAKAMEAMAAVMTDKDEFPKQIEAMESYYTTKFSNQIYSQLSQWAALLGLIEQKLSKQACEWWKDIAASPQKSLWHISKAHAERLFNAPDSSSAKAAFEAFKDSFQAGRFTDLLMEHSHSNSAFIAVDKEGPPSTRMIALGLEGLFEDMDLGASGYRALASILLDCQATEPAQAMCQKAVDLIQDTEEVIKVHELFARICMHSDLETAYKYIESCLQCTVADDTVPRDLKRKALITRGRIEVLRKNQIQAAKSYLQARTIDPTFLTTGDILSEEIKIFSDNDDKSQFIDVLMTWRPLERLAWITWDFNNDHGTERADLLQEVAVATGQVDLIVDVYREAIAYLDNVQAGAPLRIDLGFFYLMVCDNAQKTKEVTDEILDSRCKTLKYAVTEARPDYTLESAIELQSQANYILFRDSDEPTVMSELLQVQENLLTRPLALDVPPQSETFLVQRHLTLSRMYRKMGPAIEFQSSLQGMIDRCIERLRDKVGWNDADSLTQLATALSDLSNIVNDGGELRRMARTLISAQFSVLTVAEEEPSDGDDGEAENDADDADDVDDASTSLSDLPEEGDLGNPEDVEMGCSGPCKPNVKFSRWGTSVGYQCLTCYFCFLCQECYDKLSDMEDKGTRRKHPKYCEKQFGHLKAPVEGWRGVKDGNVIIEGEKPVAFTYLLERIQDDLCKKAWKDFWRN
ncbi:unnamed protein product [Fusarium graminearum]|nr:unnamed protein product [Fusarium graminearum]